MMGIIHSIIWFVWACRASAEGWVVIFCCTHIEAPTSTGRAKLKGAGEAWTRPTRSMPRKELSRGTLLTAGFHE